MSLRLIDRRNLTRANRRRSFGQRDMSLRLIDRRDACPTSVNEIVNQQITMSRLGSAMFETMLVIPFLLFLLLVIFYVSKDSVRAQHGQALVRYEAWRQATAEGMPAAQSDAPRKHPQLNSLFFGGGAARLEGHVTSAFPSTAIDNLVSALSDADANLLATKMREHFDRGRTASFASTHSDDLPLWQRFNGAITQQHRRIGHNWRFVNSWELGTAGEKWVHAGSGPWLLNPPAQEAFFEAVDQPLANFAAEGNVLAESIRQVYRGKPVYVGPTVYTPPQ